MAGNIKLNIIVFKSIVTKCLKFKFPTTVVCMLLYMGICISYIMWGKLLGSQRAGGDEGT